MRVFVFRILVSIWAACLTRARNRVSRERGIMRAMGVLSLMMMMDNMMMRANRRRRAAAVRLARVRRFAAVAVREVRRWWKKEGRGSLDRPSLDRPSLDRPVRSINLSGSKEVRVSSFLSSALFFILIKFQLLRHRSIRNPKIPHILNNLTGASEPVRYLIDNSR